MSSKDTQFKKGHKMSPEIIEKIRITSTGRKHTLESRQKMSNSQRGNKNNLGKHLSEETKKKIGLANSIILKGRKNPNMSILRKTLIGEKSSHWKGGITPENHKIRTSLEIKLWRKSCFERDKFTDQKTGITGGELQVHHINNFADFPELRTSIENGITLSKESHKEFHKLYGRRNNTRSQLEEFLKGRNN